MNGLMDVGIYIAPLHDLTEVLVACVFKLEFYEDARRFRCLHALADTDIRLGARDPDIRPEGQFNMFPSISRLFLRWRGSKSIEKLDGDHGRILLCICHCSLHVPILEYLCFKIILEPVHRVPSKISNPILLHRHWHFGPEFTGIYC